MSSAVSWSGGPNVPEHPARYVMRKLPHVTVLFWIMKILAVTLGETAGDLFGITLAIGYVATALIFLVFFLVVLALQIRAKRFHPGIFWAVVLGTSMVGTEISDFLDRGPGHASAPNGVGYGWGALILTTLLVIIFLVWWRTGQTRSWCRTHWAPPAVTGCPTTRVWVPQCLLRALRNHAGNRGSTLSDRHQQHALVLPGVHSDPPAGVGRR